MIEITAPLFFFLQLLVIIIGVAGVLLSLYLFFNRKAKILRKIFALALITLSLSFITISFNADFKAVQVGQFQQAANSIYRTQITGSNANGTDILRKDTVFLAVNEDGTRTTCEAVSAEPVEGDIYSKRFKGRMLCDGKEPARK